MSVEDLGDQHQASSNEDSAKQAKELEDEARRLANLPLSRRALERKAVAKQFGVTVDVVDVLVKGFIPVQNDGSGDEMTFDDIEPWHEPVKGTALLDEIAVTFASLLTVL